MHNTSTVQSTVFTCISVPQLAMQIMENLKPLESDTFKNTLKTNYRYSLPAQMVHHVFFVEVVAVFTYRHQKVIVGIVLDGLFAVFQVILVVVHLPNFCPRRTSVYFRQIHQVYCNQNKEQNQKSAHFDTSLASSNWTFGQLEGCVK